MSKSFKDLVAGDIIYEIVALQFYEIKVLGPFIQDPNTGKYFTTVEKNGKSFVIWLNKVSYKRAYTDPKGFNGFFSNYCSLYHAMQSKAEYLLEWNSKKLEEKEAEIKKLNQDRARYLKALTDVASCKIINQ